MMKSYVDILIHVTDALNEDSASSLLDTLHKTPGITGVHFNPSSNHLVVVKYDPKTISSGTVLEGILKHGHRAQLIGL